MHLLLYVHFTTIPGDELKRLVLMIRFKQRREIEDIKSWRVVKKPDDGMLILFPDSE